MIGRKLCSIQVVPFINSRLCRWVLRMPLQLSKDWWSWCFGDFIGRCALFTLMMYWCSDRFSVNILTALRRFSVVFVQQVWNWKLTNVILLAMKCPTWVMLYHVRVCAQMKRTWTRSGPDLLLGLSQSWEHLWVCAHTIGGLSGIVEAAPIHALTQEGAVFNWSSECEETFRSLKHALSNPPLVAHPTLGCGVVRLTFQTFLVRGPIQDYNQSQTIVESKKSSS